MTPRLLADTVLVAHGLFIAFVLLGGLAVARWPRLAWLHLPAVAWGAWVSAAGWICPLTPLENHLRQAAGQAGYAGGFIEHYLVAIIYPEGLTRGLQLLFGGVVIGINLLAYGALWRRLRSSRQDGSPSRPR